MNVRRFFLAPAFGAGDFNWYFIRQLVLTLVLAHADYWVAKYALECLFLHVLQLGYIQAETWIPFVFFAPFAFVGYVTYTRLAQRSFRSRHASRSTLGLLIVCFGELSVAICIRYDMWPGGYYSLFVTVLGFILFLRWFSEGPNEALQRRSNRLLGRNE